MKATSASEAFSLELALRNRNERDALLFCRSTSRIAGDEFLRLGEWTVNDDE